MAVAASKVKAICTGAEVALVRASRKPELEKLTAAELKSYTARARKLFDKWQGQGRKQARTQVRHEGSPDLETNTKLKAQIFREALDSFEARAAKLSAAGQSAKKPASREKKSRAAEHRTRRAAVRTGMTAALDLVNSKRQAAKGAKKQTAAKKQAKVAVKKAPVAAPPVEVKSAAKPLVKPKKSAVPAIAAARPAPPVAPSPAKQLKATTVAKQARIAKSGKTTRLVGHISARGRKTQARRDAKN